MTNNVNSNSSPIPSTSGYKRPPTSPLNHSSNKRTTVDNNNDIMLTQNRYYLPPECEEMLTQEEPMQPTTEKIPPIYVHNANNHCVFRHKKHKIPYFPESTSRQSFSSYPQSSLLIDGGRNYGGIKTL